MTLAPGFEWIGTWPACVAFGVATVLEVAGYYIPCVDNFLDTVATPAAVVAGTMATASMVSGMDPFLKWTVAIIAGGGVAGLIQGATAVTRATSSLTTGGFLNPVLATAELGGAITTSLLSFVAPVLMALILVAVVTAIAIQFWRRRSTVGSAGVNGVVTNSSRRP